MTANKQIITGKTKIAGIFGYPVSHSFSPAMHNAAYKALGLDIVYVPFEVHPKEIKAAVNAVRTLNLIGVNVTVPHKEKVIPFLDKIDPLAKRIGSVNTIINQKGTLIGYNTDSEGFIKDLLAHKCNPKGKTVCVLGAGGAGKAVAAAIERAGAKIVYICDTNNALAAKTARRLLRAKPLNRSRLPKVLKETDILINATPCGMRSKDPLPIDARLLHPRLFVYDLVYNRQSELVLIAKQKGARAATGIGMLLRQGTRAFELMTKRPAPVSCMQKELENILNKRR